MVNLIPSINEHDQNTALIHKLKLELKLKDEEIERLHAIIATLKNDMRDKDDIIIVDQTIDDLMNNNHNSELNHSDESNNNNEDPQVHIIHKETLFHGKNKDDKPRLNNVIQIHYTITEITSTKSIGDGSNDSLGSPNCNGGDKKVEDTRQIGDGQPFEFVLGHHQLVGHWEMLIQEMCRGEVISFHMKNMDASDHTNTTSSDEYTTTIHKCRLELIDFWEYEEPFRPWILTV